MTHTLVNIPALESKDNYRDICNKSDYKIRRSHTSTKSWTVLTKETAKVLASFIGKRKTLDAGAGTGYISAHLEKLGASNIVTSDIGGATFDEYGMRDVYKRDHVGDSTELLPGDFEIVLLSWPPYDQDFGFRVAEKMKPGTILIYNGEGYGGCTGDDQFHDYLESNFTSDEDMTDSLNKHHVRFLGIYDSWSVYRKL
jgi:hypothetical protein